MIVVIVYMFFTGEKKCLDPPLGGVAIEREEKYANRK